MQMSGKYCNYLLDMSTFRSFCRILASNLQFLREKNIVACTQYANAKEEGNQGLISLPYQVFLQHHPNLQHSTMQQCNLLAHCNIANSKHAPTRQDLTMEQNPE